MPIYVSKQLNAASSNGIGSVSTAATSVVTLNSSFTLDTARRVLISSTAGSSTVTFTVTGKIEGGGTFVETVLGSSTGSVSTVMDYISVTSVAISSNVGIPILIGTSSVGGTPWKIVDLTRPAVELGGTLQFSSTAAGITGQFDLTMDQIGFAGVGDPFHVTPQVFNSTSPVSVVASTNSAGILNVDANTRYPVAGWRLTITSSSSSAGTVYGTVAQSGVG